MGRLENLIDRYLENKVSEEERQEILDLIRSGRIEGTVKERIAQTLSERLRDLELADSETSARGEKIFQSILAENTPAHKSVFYSREDKDHLKKSKGSYRVILRYAAAILILLVAGIFANPWKSADRKEVSSVRRATEEPIKVINSGPMPQTVELPDGSTVVLEAGGEVRYDKNFLGGREVYLAGDAFFEVTRDVSRPFFVYTNEVTTKVLGTSFRIKANQGEKEIVVAVKTGKVSVMANAASNDARSKKLQEITLTPNQQAIYKRNEHVVVKKIVEEPEVIKGHATIKDSYINESVVMILEALTESYGVDIRFDRASLSGCTLTSDIIEGEGLYDQLEIVCNALGGTYRMENDASIVIEANGCQPKNVKP